MFLLDGNYSKRRRFRAYLMACIFISIAFESWLWLSVHLSYERPTWPIISNSPMPGAINPIFPATNNADDDRFLYVGALRWMRFSEESFVFQRGYPAQLGPVHVTGWGIAAGVFIFLTNVVLCLFLPKSLATFRCSLDAVCDQCGYYLKESNLKICSECGLKQKSHRGAVGPRYLGRISGHFAIFVGCIALALTANMLKSYLDDFRLHNTFFVIIKYPWVEDIARCMKLTRNVLMLVALAYAVVSCFVLVNSQPKKTAVA